MKELKTRYDHARSFYGKAQIIVENGIVYLKSYNTRVCSIGKDGKFRRHWGGYSATTMRHINEFCKQYGISEGGKSWWCGLDVVNW